MVSDQLPSKPGAISSARAVQASLPDTVSGRDDFSATVAARSLPAATEPPVIAAPPEITFLPTGQRTAASFGLIELLTLARVTVSSPLRPGWPASPVWFQLTAVSLFLHSPGFPGLLGSIRRTAPLFSSRQAWKVPSVSGIVA